MRSLSVLVALAVVLGAACGDDDEPLTAGEAPSDDAERPRPGGAAPLYTATATVLESPDHGPQLCSGVDDSYPPQCGGPDIIGWDWDVVADEESANGTTWGSYTVVGTWDGDALTLTEPPSEPRSQDGSEDPDRFASPCRAPDSGWQVVEPEKATDEAMQAAIEYARAQPAVGGVWLDQSINPAAGREPVDEGAMNDPSRLVLNVSFTDDLDAHEAAIRERWGGPLCVSEAPATAAELDDIQRRVMADVEGFVASWTDEVRGRVHVNVIVDDRGLQQRLDDRYGEGVVVVGSMLRPVED